MTNAEIHKKITAVIDQFYKQNAPEYIQEAQLEYIGGVLHTALFLLPFELYQELKVYVYSEHGYDPGGVTDGQMTINDIGG